MRVCPLANSHGFCRKISEAVTFWSVPRKSYIERSKLIAGARVLLPILRWPPKSLLVPLWVSRSLLLGSPSAAPSFCWKHSLSVLWDPSVQLPPTFTSLTIQKSSFPPLAWSFSFINVLAQHLGFFGENCTNLFLSFPPLLSHPTSPYFQEKLNPYGSSQLRT